jgi:hypothetical protein
MECGKNEPTYSHFGNWNLYGILNLERDILRVKVY